MGCMFRKRHEETIIAYFVTYQLGVFVGCMHKKNNNNLHFYMPFGLSMGFMSRRHEETIVINFETYQLDLSWIICQVYMNKQ
jgi:hypothetical protein